MVRFENVVNKNMTRALAIAAGVAITLQPATVFAADATEMNIETFEVVETVEAEDATVVEAEATEAAATDAADEIEVAADETVVEDTTAEVVDETVADDVVVDETTADVVADEIAVADETAADVVADEATDDAVVADETAVAQDTTETTPAFDKKAITHLKEAAKNNALLSVNSFSEGLAATNQVNRCRDLAKNLLVFQYKYIYGQKVIGVAYDMLKGDNNYISLEIKDEATGEIYIKYFDFYMQDANGNNVTNMFMYHTVDHITVVEKGEYLGDKKYGMFSYPTFASKSNGTVVFDSSSYSQLISDEYIGYVQGIVDAQ